MSRTLRFHLDENCDPRIAAALRLHGVDVTTSAEAGLLAASDPEQFAYAIGQLYEQDDMRNRVEFL